jgi:hypothetical protein
MATPTVIGTKSTGDGKALAYIASWSDLTNTFGYNAAAGETHWVNSGAHETALGYGRGNIIFDAAAYLAAWSDLRAAFGASGAAAEALATQHWIECGSKEIIYGRTFLSDTITLTTGMDTQFGATVTAGAGDHGYAGMAYNDTFNAVEIISPLTGSPVNTWSTGDKIDGGLGSDTFNVIQNADITVLAGATVKNIETANLTSGGTITANTTGWTGLTDLNIEGAGASNITAAATTNVNELNSIAASIITGGHNVTVVHSTAGGVSISNASAAVNVTSSELNGTVSINQSNTANADINVAAKGSIFVSGGGTSLNASILDAVSFADRQAHIATRDANWSASSEAGNTYFVNTNKVNNQNMLGAAVAASTSVATTNAATLVAYNAGAITHAQKTAIDTAFATALPTSAAAAQAAALAVETPIFTATTNANTASVNAFNASIATFSASNQVVIDDSSAPGYLVFDTINTALRSATVTGDYNGFVSITDGSVNQNTLTSVTLNNTGNTLLNGDALTNLTVSNSNQNNPTSISVGNNTVGHTLTLTVSDAFVYLTDTVATGLNIHSNGTANLVNIASGGLYTAVAIDGAGAFDDGASFASGLAAAAVITATASTGANSVTIAAGQSYLGGSGIDTVTTGALAQTVAVNGGEGIADKLVITNATNSAPASSAKFTGFEVLQAQNASVNAALFTKSAFTSIETSGSSSISGLNATQAANITVLNSNTDPIIDVTGASNVGQFDTVHITANDNLATPSTIALGTPLIAGVETLHFTAVDNLFVAALTGATSVTAVNIDGGGDVVLTTGALALNPNTTIDAHSATGTTDIDAGAATAHGISITGSATGNNILQGTLAFGNILTGGNGNDFINGGFQADTITAGHGNNTIYGNGGNDTITVGNGFNSITTGTGNDKITVGTGGNIIASGAGADSITFGSHVLGTNDVLVFSASANEVGSANIDTVTGFVTGADSIQLSSGGLGLTSLLGITLTAATTAKTMLSAVTDATSVANTAAVYAQLTNSLDGSPGHEFAASAAGAAGIVAREVIFTTGVAAGTYLVINDSSVGFGPGDIVVHLVGTTTVAAGDIHVV